jgi:3-deoxy-D-manno-octulosonic-acid transferase
MRIVALWSPKIRRGLRGKSDWQRLARGISPGRPGAFRLHIHAASSGEFEQAKPLIEALRAEGRPYRITASFFSPSGFEQQKGYPHIDGACYLPHDRQGEMSEFFNWLTPDLVIIIRYDLWLEFMRQARLRRVPVVLACGVLRSDSARFIPVIRSFFTGLYSMLRMIHAVEEADLENFRRLVPKVPARVGGDTRYDRVVQRAALSVEHLPALPDDRPILVAGSTWPADERLLEENARRGDLLLVIVPHEPTAERIGELRSQFQGAVTLSQLEQGAAGDPAEIDTVIVDRTGILLDLYRIARIAYVGGGFGDGVHSVLEAAAYGIPVLCGPAIGRSRDATAMFEVGALTVVRTTDDLSAALAALLDEPGRIDAIGALTGRFVADHVGATERILTSLREEGLLPERIQESGVRS